MALRGHEPGIPSQIISPPIDLTRFALGDGCRHHNQTLSEHINRRDDEQIHTCEHDCTKSSGNYRTCSPIATYTSLVRSRRLFEA